MNMLVSGVAKYAAARKMIPVFQGRGGTAKFKWHGSVGWAVYLGMLLTVNSGILESALFEQYVFLQMALQCALATIALAAAHALNKLPAIVVDLENPAVALVREYLAIMPSAVAGCLTTPRCCARLRRGAKAPSAQRTLTKGRTKAAAA